MSNIQNLLKEAKKQWWQSRLLVALGVGFGALSLFLLAAILLALFGLTHLDEGDHLWVFQAFGVGFFGYLLYQRFGDSWTSLSQQNVLNHINRTVDSVAESAELLFAPSSSLTPMQSLQVQTIQKKLAAQNISLDAKSLHFYESNGAAKGAGVSFVVAIALLVIFIFIGPQPHLQSNQDPVNDASTTSANQDIQWQIRVIPPAYTQLPERRIAVDSTKEQFNMNAPEGASIEWTANAQFTPSLRLNISQQTPQDFIETNANTYFASFVLNAPTLYSISDLAQFNQNTAEFYTLSMLRDQPPNIDIEAPTATVTEFKRSEQPVVNTQVIISDDYGLSDVFISASIAKGSGEAVKFRDEVFKFDSSDDIPVLALEGADLKDQSKRAAKLMRRYSKKWTFAELGMEPGDELYFTVNAVDNRPNTPGVTVSQTKILKWLDDDDIGITSEGILMDFIPEYFKSQRQIIIETIELIERKPLLTKDEFDETSRELAIAQSDLKLRYGQYLGDEFDTGVMQTMEAGPTVPGDSAHDHDHEHDHGEEEGENESGRVASPSNDAHDHGHNHEQSNNIDTGVNSGFDDIIEKFGHNHGEADSGAGPKTGQLNPRALMKLSIQNMWQAELFLHLSEPQSALPYEQEALDYLNRARKAERVYVKRLGFKPPPVSEDRRYEGDLDDILQPNIQQSFELAQNSAAIKRRFLSLLSQVSASAYAEQINAEQLSADALALNQQVIELLNSELVQSDKTAELLAVLAILERMNIEKKWPAKDCEACLSKVKSFLWEGVSNPIAQPRAPTKEAEHKLIEAYQRAMLP